MKTFIKYLKIFGFIALYLGIFIICFRYFSVFKSFILTNFKSDLIVLLLKKWNMGIIFIFLVPLSIYFLIFKIRKENFIDFCKFKKISLKNNIIIIILAFLGVVFTSHMINISFVLKNVPQFDRYVQNAIKEPLIISMIIYGIIIPAVEEILFRGLIFNEMRKGFPLIIVLLTHHLIYMFMQPNIQIACYAYLNFTIYALVYIFAESLWAPIIFQVLGAIGLFYTKVLKIDLFIRTLGDWYLISVTIISLIVLISFIFLLKNKPIKEIFKFNKEEENAILQK